jgi:hypothetical protein
MFRAEIAPLLDPPITAQQASGLFERIGTTIIQFPQTGSERDGIPILSGLTQPPVSSDRAIATLQNLVHLLQQLRSTRHPSLMECCLTPEELAPYVLEEALDVLDALQTDAGYPASSSLASPLMRLDRLVAPILWAIARSAYPVMELLEGTPATAGLPGEPRIPGVLRLVPLLELSTPTQSWRFDLATGQEPQSLIDPNLQIQPEKPLVLDFSTAQETHPPTIYSAHQLLQSLLNHLAACNATLQALFQGLPVDLLFPQRSWLRGELVLSLDFEFVAQDVTRLRTEFSSFQTNWVEAELLEEQEPENSGEPVLDSQPSPMPLSVMELPPSWLEPATFIRIAEQPLLDRLTEWAHQQVMAIAIAHLHQAISSPASKDPALTIIHTAEALEHWADQCSQQNFSLLQPELLIDELIPKLLWQISRSSCTVMQWIGGIPIALLQPDCPWETGTLRLIPVLTLSTCDRTCHLDLATGHFISSPSWPLESDAVIVASGEVAAISGRPTPNSCPMRVGTLLEQLLLPMKTVAPDVAMLQDTIAVEWLTPEQEWQPGQLTLCWGFEWIADVHQKIFREFPEF